MICERCKKETKQTNSCIKYVIEYEGGIRAKPFRYEDPSQAEVAYNHCPSCRVRPGGYHHLDCPEEKCPCCKGQLISCECSGKFVFKKQRAGIGG